MRLLRENVPIQIEQNLEMPTIPLMLGKLLRVLDHDSSSARELEGLILHDPSLSARILKLSNSAFYSFRSEVKSISHAIALLGLTLVKGLAIGVSIFDSFTKGMRSESRLIHQLWMHSFGVALLTQEIWTPRSSQKEGEFAFLCGLLHDLGKIFFFKRDPTQYGPLFAVEKTDSEEDLLAYEAEYYGMDHAMLGSVLAKRWGLPPELVHVIQMHHQPLESGTPLVAAVSLADVLAKQADIGYDGEKSLVVDLDAIRDLLRMSTEEWERFSVISGEKRKDVDEFFKLSS